MSLPRLKGGFAEPWLLLMLLVGLFGCERSGLASWEAPSSSEDPAEVYRTVVQVGGAQGTLFLLHGYGADAEDLMPLGRVVAPGFTMVGIEGDVSLPQGGFAWYPITFGADGAEAAPDAAALAAQTLLPFIRELAASEGLPRPYVIGGFSQGATLAAQLITRGGHLFDGALIFSGRAAAPFGHTSTSADVFVSHGTQDTVIPPSNGTVIEETLLDSGASVTLVSFEGGHQISPQVRRDARAWFSEHFSP